jgi:hypothetical protein
MNPRPTLDAVKKEKKNIPSKTTTPVVWPIA